MVITFNNGEQRVFDASILNGPVFQRLKEEQVFFNPVIDHGIITWDDGQIDCSPEYIYDHSFEYTKEAGASHSFENLTHQDF
jgi:hypothetical protein